MQSFILLNLFVASLLALPTKDHVVHEKRESLLDHPRQRLDPDAIIPLRIALRQTNVDLGHQRLMDISHPSSLEYGKHLSAEEVHDLFAPTEASVNAVKLWLLNSGLDGADILHYDNKGWLALDISASHAEKLLNTEYYEYETSGIHRIGCDMYSLPTYVSEHIDFVKPGVKLSAPLKKSTVKRDSEHWPPGNHHPGWRRPHPPHLPPHHWPHWHPPHSGHGLPPELRNCGVNITPPCIKALYNIPDAHLSQPVNVMGVFEEYDAFAQGDLDLFYKNFAPNVPQGTSPEVYSVDGGSAPVKASSERNGGESDIDIELAYSLIYPQTVIVYQVDDLPSATDAISSYYAGFFNTFLDAVDGSYCNFTAFGITGDSPIDPVYPDPRKGGYKGQLQCGKYELTRVLSISYGAGEYDLPKRYQERQCAEFMKLSLQGHSILIASGDFGVASFPGDDHDKFGCLSGNGQKGTIYNPGDPSGCPYITSVGATQLYPDQTVNDPESAMQVNLTAWHIEIGTEPLPAPYGFFASSGGFSNFFTRPSYQEKAVSEYFAQHDTLPYYIANADASNIGENGGVYNRAGRGFPDVSANGAYLLSYNNLTRVHFFGTSLSSPIFASVITLINEERTAVGKGPVGFINPVLYKHPYVLNDITNGSNPNCGSSGFVASTGWDPVTGLGTPNYPKMLELFMGLP